VPDILDALNSAAANRCSAMSHSLDTASGSVSDGLYALDSPVTNVLNAFDRAAAYRSDTMPDSTNTLTDATDSIRDQTAATAGVWSRSVRNRRSILVRWSRCLSRRSLMFQPLRSFSRRLRSRRSRCGTRWIKNFVGYHVDGLLLGLSLLNLSAGFR
jgi:hypothetical protein